MARIEKTIKDYQEHLTNKGIKNIPEFIQSILDADVTQGKYSRFLLDCFLQDKFRKEDLKGGLDSTVGQTISLFHKHKNKLPEDMRSIYKYDSPGSLWNAVKQFDGELSGKEVKRDEKEKIYAETEFVYEDENTGFKIVSPLTMESAKWWGKGTRWCTSADKNNMFLSYAKDSPLLILLMPASASTARGGEKLQLWKNGDNIQFMDEADDEVTLEYVEKNWNVLSPIMKWLRTLKYIPEKYHDEEIYKLTLQENGMGLRCVPYNIITEELCKIAVQQNGTSLTYVPEAIITEKLYRLAIEKDGKKLSYVPEHMRTKELCLLAILQNGEALCSVPEYMRTEEICKIAVQQNGWAIQYIPTKFKNKEFYEIAVKQNGYTLEFIPEEMRTEEICRLAVQQNGNALNYVPKEFRTEELYKLAVQQDGYALEYIPKNMRTEELCKLAVQSNGYALNKIPEAMRTEEICKLAVQNNGYALECVPKQYKTEELCKIAFQQNEQVLVFIPEELKEKMKQYIKPEIIQIPEDKYQQTFSEIRSFFPEKSLSLTM